jgi:hypothetical protein
MNTIKRIIMGIAGTAAISLMLVSCQKELDPEQVAALKASDKGVKRPFKADTKTVYRVAPSLSGPIPVTVNGTNYLGFLYFPGKGEGNATHMGNVKTYFNQLAYWPMGTMDPSAAPPAGSLPTPITEIPNYYLLPPPIDFSDLNGLITRLPIPSSIMGYPVNSMFVNDKDEAVFTTAKGNSFTRPESPTKIVFGGRGLILGGTGKFANATGEFDYLGYFNPQDPNDAAYGAEGWIKY